MTPLHYAVKYGHFEVVKYIANILENPNLPNFQGKTAHSLAKEAGHVDIAGLLDPHTIALNRLQSRRNRGGQGGHWPPQNFPDLIKWGFHKVFGPIKVV